MRRWWESGERTVEDEARWIAESGLEFELDRNLFEQAEVVVFRGQLRLGEQRTPGLLVFPPAYLAGEHPVVLAPELDVGRHRTSEGLLCLTHDALGGGEPMYGAEAIERAERLWDLWVNDPDRLYVEEADAPDPWANYVAHTPGTALTIVDLDVADLQQGYLRAKLESLIPFRGAVTQVRATHPTPRTIDLERRVLEGGLEINGSWQRLEAHPPDATAHGITLWLHGQRSFVDRARRFAVQDGRARDIDELPALVGFVYPDEGPLRGQTHDAWLFAVIRPDGAVELPHPLHLRRDERWLRQPQLEPLASKSVGVVGVGALGSQIVELLARAGVGRLVLVDPDIVTPGIRVRNDLDLGSLGQEKVHAVAERARRCDPWCEVETHVFRFGGAVNGVGLSEVQRLDDRLASLLGACDLIVNASAHPPTGSHCSRLGHETATPVVHVWVGAGAWGARILRQRGAESGCWDCLGLAQQESDANVPPLAQDPARQEVMDRGCADPTFTGPGFELAAAATAAARLVAQTLVGDGYPPAEYDLATLTFRTDTSGEPAATYTRLPRRADCPSCGG